MTKAKYIAFGHIAWEAIWLRRFFNELEIQELIHSVILHGNNKTNFTLTKNAKSQNRTKHINMQYHYIWELVEEGELEVKWIYSLNMLANRFTKAFSTDTFCRHWSVISNNS